MIESNIYLEMILHTNLDLTRKSMESSLIRGLAIPLRSEKKEDQGEPLPLKRQNHRVPVESAP